MCVCVCGIGRNEQCRHNQSYFDDVTLNERSINIIVTSMPYLFAFFFSF